MNKDVLFVLGGKEEGGFKDILELQKALSILYFEILGTNNLLFLFFPIFFYSQLFLGGLVLQQFVLNA
jgi:hypothetical protein